MGRFREGVVAQGVRATVACARARASLQRGAPVGAGDRAAGGNIGFAKVEERRRNGRRACEDRPGPREMAAVEKVKLIDRAGAGRTEQRK